MNTTELLDQFILEAREGLEQIGQRLLEVEKRPDDAELLNDLFRLVHTLKGNCGLFEFKALETVVHAGEDVLDRVRSGSLAYGSGIADALLEAMDFTAELIDAIAADGRLDPASMTRAQVLAKDLRRHLASPQSESAAPPAGAAMPPSPAPDWVTRLPEAVRIEGRIAMRYQPEPECFFKGEDPWSLALALPGLRHLEVAPRSPWPDPAAFDCYRCNLDLVMVSDAPRAYLEEHVRYVPEQVEWHVIQAPVVPPAAAPGRPELMSPGTGACADDGHAVVVARAAEVWRDQCELLARPELQPATVVACRTALGHLLAALGDARSERLLHELDDLPSDAAALMQWARRHRPEQSEPGDEVPNGEPTDASTRRSTTDESSGDRAHRVLKVSQDKVDRLIELIGEMVVAKNALPYLAERAETVFQQRDLAREIKTQYAVINRIAEDMQHAIMQVRMLPVGTVFQRFGRLVRDTSKRLGKEVRLLIEGEDTEADKNVIESLADPLVHILRNCLDHGLETPERRLAAGKPACGTLRVSARQESDRVVLRISDDGAGIDPDRVRAKAVERGLIPGDRASALTDEEAQQLVFLPGFSTAESISDLSGRGVGMDVVRNAVERINGTVQLSSRRGEGTTVTLSLPLSMAVTNVMMIEVGGRRFGVPMDLIVETVRVPAEDIHHFKQARTTVLRGRIVPLRSLPDLLGLEEEARLNDDGEHALLVVRVGEESIGLLVDDFHGTSDIILKPLEGVLAGISAFSGTALMGDGSVLMILNPKELF
jgi:two-component system chemotaxis sensor kinase CheA